MKNRYGGNCTLCKRYVKPKEGRWRLIPSPTRNFYGLRCPLCYPTVKRVDKTRCDICDIPEASKQRVHEVLYQGTITLTIRYHKDCLHEEMKRIWKEIFQAQELKRKV